MKSGYTALWLLLAVALAVIIAISFSDDISVGEYTVKKAPFREMLLADEARERREAEMADSIREVARIEQEKARVVVDSTPQSILLIGDSMTMNLALRLAQYAAWHGHTFHAVNWDSSNTIKWANSDRLDGYIKEYNPTIVFISLGANELYLRNPDSHAGYVRSIIEKIGDRAYVWIGPPNWKEDFGVNDMIERECAPGAFFRSAGMDFKRKKDGIHPTRESSALWIDSIVRWIPSSAHPILLQAEPDSLNKTNANIIFLKASDK